VKENICDFGACGNGKFEPLYSEEAPHPAETALNQKGQKRYVCRPILLGEWGHGEPKEEMITEEIPEGEEEGRTEFFVEDNWLKLYLSPTVSEKGRSVPKHPDANNYDWAMPEELNNKKTDWFKTSSPAHDYIIHKGNFDVHQLENGLYTDSEGRYWVAVGPNVVNPDHSRAKTNKDIDVSEMFPGTKMDIMVQCEKEGEHYGEIF